MRSKTVSAIVLAAGLSRRMGGKDKLFLDVAGKPIVQWTVENAIASQVDEVVVVAGEQFDKLRRMFKQSKVRVVQAKQYREGMSASLCAGIRAIKAGTGGVLILLGDQPTLRPETINRFLQVFLQGKQKIVAGRYAGVIGNPVLFHCDFFADLQRLQGDTGARSLLRRFPESVATIEIPPDQTLDVDTPEDLKRLQAQIQSNRIEDGSREGEVKK